MTAKDDAGAAAGRPRYETLTRLATGGMAEITLAREVGATGVERLVVIKRLLQHMAADQHIVDMFVSEARFVAQLVHPNVVQIHELAKDDDGYFLVMEYVRGCSVRELTVASARARMVLPPEVGIGIIEQACSGAHAAHELTDAGGRPLGLVHRDLSPHNLMIGPSGNVKLLDFGIAKATQLAEATRSGSLKGKCGYMSPEQCHGHDLDRRSDVFALGIVLWEMLVGERMFSRGADFAAMKAIVAGDFDLPSVVRPSLPTELDEVIAKALAIDVTARWQTAEAFRRALLDVAEECDLRPTRDAVEETLHGLLGAQLEERTNALRMAAVLLGDGDDGQLHDALVAPYTAAGRQYFVAEDTPDSSEDVATAVRPGSQPPDSPSVADEADDTRREPSHVTETPTEIPDETTLVKGAGPSDAPEAAAERAAPDEDIDAQDADEPERRGEVVSDSQPAPAQPRRGVMLIALLVAIACAAALYVATRGPADAPAATSPSATAPAASSPSATAPAASSPSATAPAGPPLRFAMAPTVEADIIQRELAPLLRWLQNALDRPVELVVADSYDHTGELVVTGAAEVAQLPPLLFVQTFAREPRLSPVAIRLADGARASDGYLLVRHDAPLKDAKDLKGKTVCHVSRTSTTGYLIPRRWMREAGLDPDKDVRIVISGDHQKAIRDLAAGRCDAASVYSGAFLTGRERGIPVGALRMLAVTGRVPQDVIVATPDLPAAQTKQLRDTLLDFQPLRDIGAPRVGEVLGISGFATFDEAEFKTIREAARLEGIIR